MTPGSKKISDTLFGEFENGTTVDMAELLVEYYNAKYKERGAIKYINIRNAEHWSSDINEAKRIMESFTHSFGTKILLSSSFGSDIHHSTPIALFGKKVVFLRSDHCVMKDTIEELLKAGGFEEVTMVDVGDSVSIQGDSNSCVFIAAGILKDLDSEDMKYLAECGNGYDPLPKMLKYSQSRDFLGMFSDLLDSKIDKKTTLSKYFEKYRGEVAVGGSGSRISTRIGNKVIKFKANVSALLDSDLEKERDTSAEAAASSDTASPVYKALAMALFERERGSRK